jgi:DNA invertase Pin-like site-specific DNA recombinase
VVKNSLGKYARIQLRPFAFWRVGHVRDKSTVPASKPIVATNWRTSCGWSVRFPIIERKCGWLKNSSGQSGIFIPTSAKNAIFARLERLLYLRIDFLHFALPGVEQAVYQLSMIKKFIGYYRVSTKMQGIDGNGMSSQRDIVRRFVESQNGVLEKEFSEVESGKWTDDERPQLAAALEYAKKINGTVAIAKLDRLGRNAEFLLRLQNSGADFVACDCPSADKFTIGILALLAQRERELISERTRLGLAAAKAKGIKLGNPNPQNALAAMKVANKTAKVEFAVKVFPIIQEIKSAGVSTLRGICECLNRRGIPTRNGKNWYPATVRNILKIQNA